jgi:hypothetical protein
MNTNLIPSAWLKAAGLNPADQLFIVEYQLGNMGPAYYVSDTPYGGPMRAEAALTPKEAFDEYVKVVAKKNRPRAVLG